MIKLFDSNIDQENFLAENIDSKSFVKTAVAKDLPKEVDEAIKGLARREHHKYVLLSAMGDGETWGSNKNADYFPTEALLGIQRPHEKINKDKGPRPRHETFEDAHFFHHHRNKIEMHPHFGYVAKSVWFPRMHTVLLLVGVDAKKDPQTADEIERGILHAFSMGARLPWDECSICKNKAKKRSEYCECLRLRPNKVLDDGRKVFSYNREPNFFDISKVTKPAFEAGHALMKVASEYSSILSVDIAEEYMLIDPFDTETFEHPFIKQASVYSRHMVEAVEAVSNSEAALEPSELRPLIKYDFPEIWGQFASAGIIPTPAEFAFIILAKSDKEELAEKYLAAHVTLSLSAKHDLHPELSSLLKVRKAGHNFSNHALEARSIDFLNDRLYRSKQKYEPIERSEELTLAPIMSRAYLDLRQNLADAMLSVHKTASMGQRALLAGGAVLAPYVYSAHTQNKQMIGEQTGPIQNIIASNPGKLAATAGLAVLAKDEFWKTIKAFKK